MTAREYFRDWARVVDVEEADCILKTLSASKAPICPLLKDVFQAFRLCSLDNLKVVIIGQDPYPNIRQGKPVATGVAFANHADTPQEYFSSSLGVLMDSVIDFTVPHQTINFDPSLEKWEEQGVLMLNAALTCLTGKPGSHQLLWRPFLKSLLLNLSQCMTGIVYVLMGSVAQSLESFINKETNHIIRIRHPSWYARTGEKMPPDIWKQVNQILIGQYGYGIEWYKEVNNH